MSAFPRASQRSEIKMALLRSYSLLCVRSYKDVTPTEPFFNGLLRLSFEGQTGAEEDKDSAGYSIEHDRSPGIAQPSSKRSGSKNQGCKPEDAFDVVDQCEQNAKANHIHMTRDELWQERDVEYADLRVQ